MRRGMRPNRSFGPRKESTQIIPASLLGWRPSLLYRLEDVGGIRFEAIAIRLEAIVNRLQAIAIRLEAITIRLEVIVITFLGGHRYSVGGHRY